MLEHSRDMAGHETLSARVAAWMWPRATADRAMDGELAADSVDGPSLSSDRRLDPWRDHAVWWDGGRQLAAVGARVEARFRNHHADDRAGLVVGDRVTFGIAVGLVRPDRAR